MLADRIHRINPSATLEMTAKAAELKRLNKPVYNMSVGEPDFSTPLHIQKSAQFAISNDYTKYTPGSGTHELKSAIVTKIKRDNNLDYSLENVIVSCGGKHSLYNACQVLFQSGDEVIIFSPYWVSFPDFVSITGAKPVFVKTNPSKQFEPDFEDLKNKINDKTKGVIVNSPSNPTGGVWSNEAMLEVYDICRNKNIWMFSDECYEQLVYNQTFDSLASLVPDSSRVLTFQSCSKTYAMTGWRIGYTIGDSKIISAMSKLQGQSTSCPNSIAQYAATEALLGNQQCVIEMRKVFEKRRNLILQELNKNKNITCEIPKGAFYIFPDFSHYLNSHDKNNKIMKSSTDLAMYILNETGVVSVAGDSFGSNGHIRFSYATSEETIKTAMSLTNEALQKLIF